MPKLEMIGLLDIKGQDSIRRVYDPDGLAPTLTTCGGGCRQVKILDKNGTESGNLPRQNTDACRRFLWNIGSR